MAIQNKNTSTSVVRKGDDEFTRKLLHLYFPKEEESGTDILSLNFIKVLEYDKMRCHSLTNERVYKDWKKFLNALPDSKNETVPWPEEKYWRWKMYKKYIPEERTYFRKTMKAGPNFDKYGRLPITGEELRLFRGSSDSKKLRQPKKLLDNSKRQTK